MNGHELEWQNWKMHIGDWLFSTNLLIFTEISPAFSHREGIVISTITYNDHGEVRPIIYRLSVPEMVVP